MRADLPTGTVTFLFTDVEGSTRLLHALGPDAYAGASAAAPTFEQARAEGRLLSLGEAAGLG